MGCLQISPVPYKEVTGSGITYHSPEIKPSIQRERAGNRPKDKGKKIDNDRVLLFHETYILLCGDTTHITNGR